MTSDHPPDRSQLLGHAAGADVRTFCGQTRYRRGTASIQVAKFSVSAILQRDGVTDLDAGLDNLEQLVKLNVMDEHSNGFHSCIADVSEIGVPTQTLKRAFTFR